MWNGYLKWKDQVKSEEEEAEGKKLAENAQQPPKQPYEKWRHSIKTWGFRVGE